MTADFGVSVCGCGCVVKTVPTNFGEVTICTILQSCPDTRLEHYEEIRIETMFGPLWIETMRRLGLPERFLETYANMKIERRKALALLRTIVEWDGMDSVRWSEICDEIDVILKRSDE